MIVARSEISMSVEASVSLPSSAWSRIPLRTCTAPRVETPASDDPERVGEVARERRWRGTPWSMAMSVFIT